MRLLPLVAAATAAFLVVACISGRCLQFSYAAAWRDRSE